MGYKNNNVGYPSRILESRAIVKKNNYALIPHDGLVENVVPGFENCSISILASKHLGASFNDYICEFHKGGKNTLGFGGEGIETFIYVIKGHLKVSDSEESHELTDGGFVYLPANELMYFENLQEETTEAFLYQRRYEPFGDKEPYKIVGNKNDITPQAYEGMKEVLFWSFLPSDDVAFDMNFHVLEFQPGASHGYIETHYQEHGAYLTSGKGMYNLDNEWFPVEKGDYIFMARYTQQAAYAVGKDEPLAYVYSKDANRNPQL